MFADLCADLTAEQVDVVGARLLPRAGGLTTGELAARIKKLVIAFDPEWAARRYATAVRDRNVIGYLTEDGSATVTVVADPDACGDWAAVVADLAAQTAQHARRGGGRSAQGPTARFAGAVLRRHVEIRDRSCIYPGLSRHHGALMIHCARRWVLADTSPSSRS